MPKSFFELLQLHHLFEKVVHDLLNERKYQLYKQSIPNSKSSPSHLGRFCWLTFSFPKGSERDWNSKVGNDFF